MHWTKLKHSKEQTNKKQNNHTHTNKQTPHKNEIARMELVKLLSWKCCVEERTGTRCTYNTNKSGCELPELDSPCLLPDVKTTVYMLVVENDKLMYVHQIRPHVEVSVAPPPLPSDSSTKHTVSFGRYHSRIADDAS